MPRNAAGNYTLPAGNPVVPDTDIEASWANTTLSDVATELQNSVDRAGRGGLTGPLKLADGSATAPGLAFNSDTNCGMYRIGTDEWALVAGGVVLMTLKNDKIATLLDGLEIDGLLFKPTEYARLDGASFTGGVVFAGAVNITGALTHRAVSWAAYAELSVAAGATQNSFDFTALGAAVAHNVGTGLVTTTGVFTAPYTGLYLLTLSANGVNAVGGTNFQARVTKNGSDMFGAAKPMIASVNDSTGVQPVVATAVVSLTAGDVITPTINHSAGSGTLTGNIAWSGCLLQQL